MGTRDRPPASGLALAALSAATALSLLRVFDGAGWLAAALGAAGAPHALSAWLARRRSPSLALPALLAAGGVAYPMVVVEPGTTFHGIPTTATLAAFGRHLGDAPGILRTAVVPVAPRGGALLLALVALWVAASIAIWCARSIDGLLGAVSPSLVMFVAISALGDGASTAVTVAYAAAACAYLLTGNLTRVAARYSWSSGERAGRGRTRLLAQGLGAGAMAVMLGALIGPSLPGARSAPLLDYRDLGDKQGPGRWQTVSPLVDIRGRLVQNPPTELFTVRSTRDAYWRLVALDQFDGSAWVLGEKEAPPAGDRLPSGDAGPVDNEVVIQHFRLGPLASRWLPAAYRPTEIELRDAYVIEEVLTLVAGDELSDGLEYEVVSHVATPEPDDLAASEHVRGDNWSEYLALPDDFPARVGDLAADVVDSAGARSPYEIAIALQTWMRDPENFTYTLDARGGHGSSAIETFLFDTRSGYCEQFAGSFAAMARSVGLPARVAVGFTPGIFDPEAGVYRVTSQEAHAWPEVYLSGIGWTAFEPTPGRFEPTPGDPTGTQAERSGSDTAPTTTTTAVASTTTTPPSARPTIPQFEQRPGMQVGTDAAPDETSWFERVMLGTALVVSVALAAALAYAGAAVLVVTRRRSLRRKASTNRLRVTGAWDEAVERLAEAGIERRPSSTPVEFALRHAPAHGAGAAGPPLMDLARLHTAAVFSPHEPADDDAAAAWEHASRIGTALRETAPAGQRWRRRLDPRVLRRARHA